MLVTLVEGVYTRADDAVKARDSAVGLRHVVSRTGVVSQDSKVIEKVTGKIGIANRGTGVSDNHPAGLLRSDSVLVTSNLVSTASGSVTVAQCITLFSSDG